MTGKGIVLFYNLLLVSVVFAVQIPFPQNKAVRRGTTNVVLNCSASISPQTVVWSLLPVDGSTIKPIATGAFVNDPDNYNVLLSGNSVSTLIIKAVTESLAGTYTCSESGGGFATSQLIVYNSDPVCASNVNPGQNLTAGQSVQMNCSFSYTASRSSVGVNFVWSKVDPLIQVADNTTFPTDGTAVSNIAPTVGYSSPFPVYQCKMSFTVTGTNATNDPGYTNTTQLYSSPINVLYFNPTCSINGAKPGDRVYFGTNISCVADANPKPSYRWSNETNATLSSDFSVLIMNDGDYTCTASNGVGNCTQSISLRTYTTTAPPTPTTITTITPPTTSSESGKALPNQDQPSGTQPPTTEGGGLTETNKIIVGVVVGVGGFLLILAIIGIVCCCMKKNKSGGKYENGNQDITQMTSGAYKKMGTEGNLHQKQVSTNVSSASQPNSAPKKLDDVSAVDMNKAVDTNKVANAKPNEDGLVYADLERDSHPSVLSEQSDKNPDGKITDNGNYADIREA